MYFPGMYSCYIQFRKAQINCLLEASLFRACSRYVFGFLAFVFKLLLAGQCGRKASPCKDNVLSCPFSSLEGTLWHRHLVHTGTDNRWKQCVHLGLDSASSTPSSPCSCCGCCRIPCRVRAFAEFWDHTVCRGSQLCLKQHSGGRACPGLSGLLDTAQ